MLGRTPAAKSAASCFSTPRPPPAALLRRSRNAAQPTTTNATNSSIATAGRSSAQTRFEAGDFAQRADDKTPSLPCPLGAPLSDNLGIVGAGHFAPDFCMT